MKLMWQYTMRHKKLLLLNFLCVFGFIVIELGLPTLLGRMIDSGLETGNMENVKKIGWYMVIITVIGITLHIMLSYVGAKLNNRIIVDLRDDMFENIQQFSHGEYEQIGVSSLITRVTNDAYQVMLFLGQVLRTGFMTPMMFIASITIVIKRSPLLARYVFLALPFLTIGIIIIAKYSKPLSERQQTELDNINGIMRENLSGLRVIRAFVNEKFEEKRFDQVNAAFTDTSTKLFKLVAAAQPAFFFLFNLVMVLIIWMGAKYIDMGQLEVGNLIATIEYVFHALFSFMLFTVIFMMYPRAAVSANRIQEVLELSSTITDKPDGVKETRTNGVVSFNQVTFAYPGTVESPVIRDVSFEVNPGETIAFIGSTGSGKSTLIQLIPRFYDVTKGSIQIDGVDVRDYNLHALRQKIGYIPQKAILFEGSIRDNLLMGKPDATEEDLDYALEIAQATEFVASKPKGLEEHLSEGGSNFSGGQKQRLAIARAIIRRPAIYIFDDSFSALDYQTDAKLREQLKKETKQSTVMIVAQRISSIMDADKIVVLNEGEVVGLGTHQELLDHCDIYRDIAFSQLSKEELAHE
ncbi:ABC transporter ATP-binding protein [Vagococcus humatus]|uniref:Multidrug ABC transporter ATP-binding protein n=1 Tax=Vagococcus humatus TaxID=1889241 RepID=A0A429Z8U2_9ENTE|nr:ABC transporter ATP-binding protein [Vagococcus humatus]RST90140.1 multidrug ABC transporter ATP-binding protein [Vagococcus humatus]